MTITEFINLLQNIEKENFEIYVYNELNLLVPPKIEYLNKELNEKRELNLENKLL